MPDPEPLGVGIVHAVNAVDQYIRMLELEKTIVEADMTALETFSRDTQVIMHKAIYLEWVKWGWKGSNEQTAVQKVRGSARWTLLPQSWLGGRSSRRRNSLPTGTLPPPRS